MKKACILVMLVLYLFVSYSLAESNSTPDPYEKEIMFRGIEWEQSIPAVNAKLKDESIEMSDGSSTQPLFCERFGPYSGDVHPKYDVGMDTLGRQLSKTITAAGHEISMITMYYYYDLENGVIDRDPEKTHLYMATYILKYNKLEEAYIDLRTKLVQLYGEGQEESDGRTYGIKSHVWYGANNTAVRLSIDYGTASDPGFYLVYYKTDSTEHIKMLNEIAQEEQAQKDRENWQENTDGL